MLMIARENVGLGRIMLQIDSLRNYLIWIILGLSLILFFMMGDGRHYGEIWVARILCVCLASATALSIYWIGNICLSCFKILEENWLHHVLSFAVGTWIMSVIILVLGTLGWLHQYVALALVLVPLGLGYRIWQKFFVYLKLFSSDSWTWLEKCLLCLALFVLVLNVTHAFLPAWDYDVLEYHFAAGSEYLKAGKIAFLQDNVYANFPQTMEMLAYFCMILMGKWFGAIMAQILLQVYGIALLLAVFGLARSILDSAIAARTSCLLVFLLPWTSELLQVYYVEIPLVFYIILALCIWCLEERQISPYQRFFWTGALFGMACSIKYNALFLGLPAFFPWFLWTWWKQGKRVWVVPTFAAGLMLAFSPWLIRNWANTGNPIYPLWNSWIIPGYWTDWMYARFRYAHEPRQIGFIQMLKHLARTFFWDSHTSLLHLSLLIPGLGYLLSRSRNIIWFIVIWLWLWLGYTNQIERFVFVIWIICGIGMGPILQWACTQQINLRWIMPILFLLLAYHHAYLSAPMVYDHFVGTKTSAQWLQETYPPYEAEQFIQENLQDHKLLVVGEARIFYLDCPIVSSTVFDRNLLETLFQEHQQPKKIAQALQNQNIHFIYVNWQEIARLQDTYSFPYQGKRLPGFLWVEPQRLQTFFQTQCIRIFPTQKATIEIYQISEKRP